MASYGWLMEWSPWTPRRSFKSRHAPRLWTNNSSSGFYPTNTLKFVWEDVWTAFYAAQFIRAEDAKPNCLLREGWLGKLQYISSEDTALPLKQERSSCTSWDELQNFVLFCFQQVQCHLGLLFFFLSEVYIHIFLSTHSIGCSCGEAQGDQEPE